MLLRQTRIESLLEGLLHQMEHNQQVGRWKGQEREKVTTDDQDQQGVTNPLHREMCLPAAQFIFSSIYPRYYHHREPSLETYTYIYLHQNNLHRRVYIYRSIKYLVKSKNVLGQGRPAVLFLYLSTSERKKKHTASKPSTTKKNTGSLKVPSASTISFDCLLLIVSIYKEMYCRSQLDDIRDIDKVVLDNFLLLPLTAHSIGCVSSIRRARCECGEGTFFFTLRRWCHQGTSSFIVFC